LLEALAAGLLPVVTDIDANKPFVNENSLFKKGDHQDLANGIIKALYSINTPCNDKISNEHISWSAIAQKYIQQFNLIADKPY
jgi:glycosyltransferase involved in cell wall biosynthesis